MNRQPGPCSWLLTLLLAAAAWLLVGFALVGAITTERWLSELLADELE